MKFDQEHAKRILAGLRRQLEPRESDASERWDVPGLNCALPTSPDGESSVGDADVDTAVDAVNLGSAVVAGLPDDALTDEGLVQLLSDIAIAQRRLGAAYLNVVSLVDKRGAAKCSGIGAQTTQELLKALAGIMPGRAKADVADARALHGEAGNAGSALVPGMPDTDGPLTLMADLLADGKVSIAQIDTAVRTLQKVPTDILNATMRRPVADEGNNAADDEGPAARIQVRENICNYFADVAPSTSPENLRRLGRHLIEVLVPDADDHYDPESYERRSMTMSTDSTGMVFGDYQLDPVAGAALRAILDPLSAPRPVQRDEDGNVVVRDTRTPEQRRADGLSELVAATASLVSDQNQSQVQDHAQAQDGALGQAQDGAQSGQPDAGLFELIDSGDSDAGVKPSRASRLRPGRRPARITVVSTAEKIKGADRTPSHCSQIGDIGSGTLTRLACDATFERLVLDAHGAVLDLGLPVRLASPAQKRAVSARDKGCVFPGCDRPPSWCDVHHVRWHSRGGPTDVGNLCLLCPAHHSLVHSGRWEMIMIDGIPYARPAAGSIKVKVAGAVATVFDTYALDGGWVRNSYFDRLKETEEIARAITRARPDAA